MVSRNQQELLRQLQSGQQRLEMAMDYFLANRHPLYPGFTVCSSSILSCGWPVSKRSWKDCVSACVSLLRRR
jgi:hypothetical protein